MISMARLGTLISAAVLALVISSPAAADFTRDVGNFVLNYDVNDGPFLVAAILKVGVPPKSFSAHLGASLSPEMLAEMKPEAVGSGVKLHFGEGTTLELQPAADPQCSTVTWTSQELTEIRDCIDYGTQNWFAGFEQKEQLWPVEKLVKSNYSMVTKEQDNMGVAERFWLNSEGVYLYVEPYVPLFIDSHATGDNKLCFIAKFEQPFIAVPELRLHYQVCSLPTAKEGHLHALNSVLNGRPTAPPDERMVRDPIWSTWARYKRRINETTVLAFAQEILDYGYSNSQLEIDDDWETCYGELTFDLEKFPDPARLSQQLKSLGFRVTLWIHPFINTNCPSFTAFKEAGYLASDENGETHTIWWNGLDAAIIDFSNPAAVTWFVERIRALKTLSEVDSFKFDAGETSWLPKPRVLQGDPSLQPNLYTTAYVRALAEFGPLTEVRTGFQTQDVPLFVRMVDKDSRWSWSNGIKTIVTTLLAMNTAGYPYVLPDMIGGNGYGIDIVTPELFIRWLQASTFMPSLQFSYVPWDFTDPQVQVISKKFVDLHAEYTPVIMEAANQAMLTGYPINTPVWMSLTPFSDDPEAYTIDDEYMLGESILVAPVLDRGAISRNIYLPQGIWQDLNTGIFIDGKQWLRDYPAPLDVLPYFQLVGMSGAQTLNVPLALLAICAIALSLFNL